MKRRTLPPRTLAEWTTLVLSITVIGALIVYLVMDLRSPASPYVEIAVRSEYGEVRQVGNRYVLPIDIENKGDKAVGRANIRITIHGSQGPPTDDFEIQYLGWPQPKRELVALCRDRGILLIEDCARALLSGS